MILRRLLDAIMPNLCPVCRKPLVRGEQIMCLECRLNLPVTDYHTDPLNNKLHEKLMCHAPIQHAGASFFYERGGRYARIIHRAKYDGAPSIARQLGREWAEVAQPGGMFDGVECLVPIPLSPTKIISRGYNQSYHASLGISDVAGLPVVEGLKARMHGSQTRRSAHERMLNAAGIYSVIPSRLDSINHLMLIDDIITTGATICACAEAIHKAHPSITISVGALAATRIV